jgi:pimeloyl-ACP methyl ester carboxylesterase
MFHSVGSRQIHSLSFGKGPATLVGVAGAFANWEIWAPVFELLSPEWRVVGFDHDGVGETKVPVEEISHDRHVETLFSVLDAQGVERCVVAGDSANAAVAIDAVLQRPERFDGLVVANGHAWGFDRPEVRQFVDGLRTQFEPTVDFFVELVFPEPDSGHLKRWLRDIIIRTGAEAAARILEANYAVDLRPRLAEVRVPTVIVHGVLDAISPTALDDATALATMIPGARMELIDDAGHLPLLSRPAVVADILDAFLASTMAPAAG